ncbi:uncharacterized protein LOC125226076 [Leguminivora glycinivorella]|uniref:uncharacterized protein LOC125226076 n=1 Tax=Leguminivora glycinivorella TaxID=1035111 RepID=UPI002010436D|nr:uncharacterized protein LOC125226076 [Leguminivora glycinivorella]
MSPNATDTLLPQHKPLQVQQSRAPRPIADLEKATSTESCKDIGVTECNCKEMELGAGDAVFACFVVAPLVVGFWRGTWGLMDLAPDSFPYAQTYVLAIMVHVCFALLRSYLLSRSVGAWGEEKRAGRWLRERALSRLYAYMFMMSNIMHWRGGWGLFDGAVALMVPAGEDKYRPIAIAALTLIFYVCLLGLRASKNLLAPPYFLVTDGKEPTYIFTTRFKTKVS